MDQADVLVGQGKEEIQGDHCEDGMSSDMGWLAIKISHIAALEKGGLFTPLTSILSPHQRGERKRMLDNLGKINLFSG